MGGFKYEETPAAPAETTTTEVPSVEVPVEGSVEVTETPVSE